MNAHGTLPTDIEGTTSTTETTTTTTTETTNATNSASNEAADNRETRVSFVECISDNCDEFTRMGSFAILIGLATFVTCMTFGIIYLCNFEGQQAQENKINDIANNLDCDMHKSLGDLGSQYYFTCSGPNNRTNEALAFEQTHQYMNHNQRQLVGGLLLTLVGGFLGPYAGCGVGLLMYVMLDNLIERLPSLPRLSLPNLPSLNLPAIRTLFNTRFAMSNNYHPQHDEQSRQINTNQGEPDVETPTTTSSMSGPGASGSSAS